MLSPSHHIVDDAADAAALAKGTNVTADFDSIKIGSSGSTEIKDGYSQMDWDQFDAISPLTGRDFQKYKGSGYDVGITSGKQDAYNDEGFGCNIHLLSGTFTMVSVEMTAVFYKKMKIEIYAFDSNDNVKHDKTFIITDAKPTLIQLDWTGVTEVDWKFKGGSVDPVWGKKGDSETDFAFDDFKFSDIKGRSTVPPTHEAHQSVLAGHDHLLGHAPLDPHLAIA